MRVDFSETDVLVRWPYGRDHGDHPLRRLACQSILVHVTAVSGSVAPVKNQSVENVFCYITVCAGVLRKRIVCVGATSPKSHQEFTLASRNTTKRKQRPLPKC